MAELTKEMLLDIRDLVRAVLTGKALATRQWVQDAVRARLDWSSVERPVDADDEELAVSAGLVELLASREKQNPPKWTASVGAPGHDVWLVKPTRLRRARLPEESPAPLRARRVYAPENYLSQA